MFTKIIDIVNEEMDRRLDDAERARFERWKMDGTISEAVLICNRATAHKIREAFYNAGVRVCVIVSDNVGDGVYMVTDKVVANTVLEGYHEYTTT